jgi:hypothetical protein
MHKQLKKFKWGTQPKNTFVNLKNGDLFADSY